MHVLFVPSWYPTREAPLNGTYFAEQAQALDAEGMNVGVVYPEHQSLRRASWRALRENHFQLEWTEDYGIPTLRRHGWNVWWRFPPGLRLRVRCAVRLARRYVERHGVPDLIHALSARWAGAAAARLSRELSVPYVLTEHYTGFQRRAISPWRWPLVEEGYRHASGIAAVSPALKNTISSLGLANLPEIEVHPNLVDDSLFSLPPSPRPTPPPFRFVTVARLRPQKNMAGLLEAFAGGFAGQDDVTLDIVGDGPERSLLEQRAERLGIRSQISFLGRRDRDGVREALWDTHAFVLPSRHETFGVVLIEAMATGLPVIATACGGPEDIVTPETGLLVQSEDPATLEDALCTMRQTRSTYDAPSIRAYALDRFGPEPFVRRIRSFYRRARATGA